MAPETFYHIYNHANGEENLFRSGENYAYFLKLWTKYIEPVAGTYAYCLMPNHFHFLIRTKDLSDLQGFQNPGGLDRGSKTPEKVLTHAFSNLFNAYTKAFNKMYGRQGSLFIPNFKKKEITSERYFTTIITYIHRNPVHHGFQNKPEDWAYSSYEALISGRPTKLRRQEVQGWFGSVEEFRKIHRFEPGIEIKSLLIDF